MTHNHLVPGSSPGGTTHKNRNYILQIVAVFNYTQAKRGVKLFLTIHPQRLLKIDYPIICFV